MWCVAFYVDFGHVRIPRDLNVPPSLRMLGIEPQSKLNCEVSIVIVVDTVYSKGFNSLSLCVKIHNYLNNNASS